MSFPVCGEEIIAPEARKERSCQSFSASHIGPRADSPLFRPAVEDVNSNTCQADKQYMEDLFNQPCLFSSIILKT